MKLIVIVVSIIATATAVTNWTAMPLLPTMTVNGHSIFTQASPSKSAMATLPAATTAMQSSLPAATTAMQSYLPAPLSSKTSVHASTSSVSKTTHVRASTSTVSKTSHAPGYTSIVSSSPSTRMPMSSSVIPTKPPTIPSTHPPTTPSPSFNFNVTNRNGTACLVIEGQVTLVVNYTDTNNTKEHETIHLQQDHGKVIDGRCSSLDNKNESSFITVSWSNVNFTLKFQGKGKEWYMSNVGVHYSNPKAEAPISASKNYTSSENNGLYRAKRGYSYECAHAHSLYMGNVTIEFINIQIEPFSFEGKPFKKTMACSEKSDGGSDNSIVPIAVGCALAGLIVIVLIAYLIGRRKGNNRGYQQV